MLTYRPFSPTKQERAMRRISRFLVRRGVALVAVFVLPGLAPVTAAAQLNFSGLLNKDLVGMGPDDMAGIMCDVFTSGTGLDGKVPKITVTEDGERMLKVRLTLEGWREATIRFDVLGADNKDLREVPSVQTRIADGATRAEATLALKPGLAEGFSTQSTVLKVGFWRPNKGCADKTFKFQLARRWQMAVGVENRIVTVVPVPMGRTTTLDPNGAVRYARSVTDVGAPPPASGGAAGPVVAGPLRDRAILDASRAHRIAAVAAAVPADTPATARPYVLARPVHAQVAQTDTTRFKRRADPLMRRRILDAGLIVGRSDPPPPESGIGGVGLMEFDLLQHVDVEPGYPMARLIRALGFNPRVYRDKSRGDLYYFLPNDYHLVWNPSGDARQRFSLAVQYRTAVGDAQPKVNMAVELSPGLELEDQELAGRLLRAHLRNLRTPNGAADIRLPLWSEDPTLTLAGDLARQYDVPADRITVNASSDIAAGIGAEWVTSEAGATDMQVRIVERGMGGNVVLTPRGDLPKRSIPFHIGLKDEDTYGPIRYERNRRWRNTLDYPVQIRQLNALMVDGTTNRPVVLSWSLGDSVVPPQALVEVDTVGLPGWVDQQALRVWIDYTLRTDCPACDARALNQLRIGAGNPSRQMVMVEAITPLKDLGLYRLLVRVRSRYFNAEDRTVVVRNPVELRADRDSVAVAPVYPPIVGETPDSVLVEYQLSAVKSDGTTLAGTRWIPSGSSKLLLGTRQVRDAIEGLEVASGSPASPADSTVNR